MSQQQYEDQGAKQEFFSAPEWRSRCVFCGDLQGEKFACCGEANHFEDQPECPVCGDNVEAHNSIVTGIETTAWKCDRCDWVSDPE